MLKSARWAAALVAFGAVFVLGAAGAQAAEETHVFDAALSLSGGCATSSLDPVPDPGCPGGLHPPSSPFVAPAIAIDNFGDMYVASLDPHSGPVEQIGSKGRVDVFSAAGQFITEISVPRASELAIDAEGNLYVYATWTQSETNETELLLYKPTVYNPALGMIAYGNPPVRTLTGELSGRILENGLAINRTNDHLFVDFVDHISEYSSAAEGNNLLDGSIGAGSLISSKRIAIDAAHNRLYAGDFGSGGASESLVRVFELSAPHHPIMTVTGSTTPAGKFFSTTARVSIATEESTGNFFVDDIEGKEVVYEFSPTGAFISSIKHGFEYVFPSQIESDNGSTSPNAGTLYVPSGVAGGHTFAFVPKIDGPPAIDSLAIENVSTSEAEVTAAVTPHAPGPEYAIEYTSQERFLEEGFAGATLAAQGQLPSGKEPVRLSAALSGLAPGVSYRVRLTTSNEFGSDEKEAGFGTFNESAQSSCPNDVARVGLSADLPDCRAYELVTPADTGGRSPLAVGHQLGGPVVGTQSVTEDGSSVAFLISGGVIPGFEGGGNFNGDGYLSLHGSSGWQTVSIALNGTQSSAPQPGALSPDHLFEAVVAGPPGPLALEGRETTYLRYPTGAFEPLGRGSLGVELGAEINFLSPQGSHVVFSSKSANGLVATPLEPDAPPAGTAAIYDRPVSEEVTHVVSLLPGNLTPAAGHDAHFLGAAETGTAVAFRTESSGGPPSDLYVRVNNSVTLDAAPPASTFEGLSADGRYLFYLDEGNLKRFDTSTQETLQITTSNDATVVNVASDGSAAFFLSPTVLTPGDANPVGNEAQPGARNLYVWKGGIVRYIATVTTRDVEGQEFTVGGRLADGLGLWAEAQSDGTFSRDPSRATADGGTFVFESRADVTDFAAGGHAEIYRYEASGPSLTCISCAPSGEVPTGDAQFQTPAAGFFQQPMGEWVQIQNLNADGSRVLFESNDALVPSDTNGRQDVYEWEAAGTGSCARNGGCISLLSSGRSAGASYLFGASNTGNDVFILTSDLLVSADTDETPSIYDAAVFGGSAPSKSTNCLGEGCRGQLGALPALASPASTATGPSGNVKPTTKCRKGTRKVKQHGKVKCVKKKHKSKHEHASRKRGEK